MILDVASIVAKPSDKVGVRQKLPLAKQMEQELEVICVIRDPEKDVVRVGHEGRRTEEVSIDDLVIVLRKCRCHNL